MGFEPKEPTLLEMIMCDKSFEFLAAHFGIQDIHYQAGNECAWSSVSDTQACIIEAGYNLSVASRPHGPLTSEIFDGFYKAMLEELQTDQAKIPRKDSYWEEQMRTEAAINVLKAHKDLVRRVAEGISPALAALYQAAGREEHPGLDPETYFRERVKFQVFLRA